MPRVSTDRQRFRNEDLVLSVSPAVDRSRWNEDLYEPFLDALCGIREYQKEAIRTTVRYLLGGEYRDLRALARENYDRNPTLEARYGSWAGMERHLQFPDQLSASLDLATGTGKSYVLYGIGAILLAESAVDRVLVLCPSLTIEAGLQDKFKALAGNAELRDLLPKHARLTAPRIIDASESLVPGSICVENYHAILEHVGSSIRDSVLGRGERVAVLSDEAHHVANESEAKAKKWKQFLLDPAYGFRYLVGVSGTCYVDDEYFADVIHRYSLRQAMEQGYVKWVNYVADMPRTGDPDEKWQLIHNYHADMKRKLKPRKLLPLTIVVTPTIARCKDVADELKAFLVETARLKPETADEQVLIVFNNAPDVARLPRVDRPTSKVEWIVSVSMLNEGWDVQRVFQIAPHEERAFNSKLLIAQVLGRGLRIPPGWQGPPPEVTVFNHDAWAPRIQDLVNEVLEIEKRVTVRVRDDSPFHFDLHNIDYTLKPVASRKKPKAGSYKLFEKGYVDLAADVPAEDVSVEFERAPTGERFEWQTRIQHRTFTVREVAEEMYRRLEEIQDPDNSDTQMRTRYTDRYPAARLEQIVKESLRLLKVSEATDSMKQAFLRSLNVLYRKEAEYVRYQPTIDRYVVVSTRERPADSVSAAELRRDKTLFVTDQTGAVLADEQVEFYAEVAEPGSGFKCVPVTNRLDFKTPLCAVIADSENEHRFIKMLLQSPNLPHYEAWIKSTDTRFYEIDYAWRKGEHPKRGKFSPDFFVKAGDLILVVEVKGDEDLRDVSEENRKKYEYAVAHFERVNDRLEREKSQTRYKFNFMTPTSFNTYFQFLREGRIANYRSELDVRLAEKPP